MLTGRRRQPHRGEPHGPASGRRLDQGRGCRGPGAPVLLQRCGRRPRLRSGPTDRRAGSGRPPSARGRPGGRRGTTYVPTRRPCLADVFGRRLVGGGGIPRCSLTGIWASAATRSPSCVACGGSSGPGGRTVVEVQAPSIGVRRLTARLERACASSEAFPWAAIRTDAVPCLAAAAGPGTRRGGGFGPRWSLVLEAPESP